MNNNQHIKSELKEIAPTLPVWQTMPYTVPASYFNNFSTTVFEKIAAENLEQIASKAMPYQLLDNYFNQFAENVLQTVQQQNTNEIVTELNAIAPFLNTISKQNIYTVPKNYFDTTIESRSNKSNTVSKTPVVSIQQSKKWWYIAVAACIFGIAVIGAFLFTNNNNTKTYNFAEAKNIDVKNSFQQLSDDELTKYLYSEHFVSNSEFVSSEFEELPDVQQHIKNISDEELNQYLKEELVLPIQKNG